MVKLLKKELILEGLDCANCAAKIGDRVGKIHGIASSSMNFITKTLSIELQDAGTADEILREIRGIVNKLEPHVVVSEKLSENASRKIGLGNNSEQVKKTFILEGLGCTNCAAKMEREIGDLACVSSAYVDFTSQKLRIEFDSAYGLDGINTEIAKIVNKIEPHVKVIEESVKSEGPKKAGKNIFDGIDKKEIIKLASGAVLFGTAVIFNFPNWTEFTLYFLSYLLVGGEVLVRAARNIARGQVFDENFLMSVATIGAFIIKEFPEGVAVMLFYQIGELFQSIAVNRSRKSIADLMDIRPDFANLKTGDVIQRVDPEDVRVGDVIVVKPGEKIPLDGRVIVGKSAVDTSALTGESLPREVEEGSDVLGGFINKSGLLTIEVVKEFGESTVSKILDLVQNASSRKAPTENFITKFARYYTPVVVFTALALAVLPPLFVPGEQFSDWTYKALIFLVISCPCALVVSIPLGFFGGIGGASKNGILIKGSNYLEALNNVETVVFDKTGTLTKGVFKVTEISPKGSISKDELLEYAAFVESYSNHPIAASILNAYGKDVDKGSIENYNEVLGHGIKAMIKGKEISAGNVKLMDMINTAYDEVAATGTVVHMNIDKDYAGYIVISDEIKEDSKKAIEALKDLGVKKTAMLTGDNKFTGAKVAEQLGLDEVYAELLPDQKVEKLEMLSRQKSSRGKLVFVGDGINDAPVLARADIGIAMGGLGSDAAIEAADVVIMTDEPSKIVSAIKIAKRTRKIVWQNIIFALGVKGIVLLLGAGGMATMWEAVFADVGVALIAVLNAMRVMNVDNI